MVSRIVATFATRQAADKAIHALKDADIQPSADVPENGGDPAVVAVVPSTLGTSGATSVAPGAVSAVVAGTTEVIDDVEDDASGNVTVSVSVSDDAEADKAIAILREHGGTMRENAQSTIDEVANPAQARDRIR